MQEKAIQSVLFLEFPIQGKIPVAGVSQEGVSDTGEVGPDLVHAARFQVDFYQVVAFVMLFDAVVGNGFFPVLVIDLHFGAPGIVCARKRCFN